MDIADIFILITPFVLFLCFWGIPFLFLKPIKHLVKTPLITELILLPVAIIFGGDIFIYIVPCQLLHFLVYFSVYLPLVKKGASNEE